jgi:opacity protein-like surface antigen
MSRLRRRLATSLIAVLLGLVCSAGDAQDIATAKGPGSYIAVGGGVSIFDSDYGRRFLGGGLIYADMNPEWRLGIEGEARYLRLHTDEDVTETNYLAGPTYTRRMWGFRPYVKLLVGVEKITLPFHYAQGTFFTYAPGGGVQYVAGDRLILRMIDFEYQLTPSFANYGQLRPYGLSAGFSVRLNPHEHFPKNAGRWRWH